MRKALFKKQLAELRAAYFRDRKTGKPRTGVKKVLYAALLLFLFAALALSFCGVADMFAGAFLATPLSWLYFTLMGGMTLLLGVFGGVFTTYSTLYLPKDNDLLLSMPIPPRDILAVRMSGVFLTDLLYCALVMLPAAVMFWRRTEITPMRVIAPIVLLFLITLLSVVLSSFLGWLVALLAAKSRKKSAATVIFSLAFFLVYYFFCFRFSSILGSIVSHAEQIGGVVRGKIYPLYLIGHAGEGDPLSLVLVALGAAVLFVLTCLILEKTFLRLATQKPTAEKVVYREKTARVSGTERALLRREWKRFITSPTYLLNSAFGAFLAPLAAIALLVSSARLRPLLDLLTAEFPGQVSLAVTAILCAFSATILITAPSVSLEGKTLWILRTAPVDARKILNAKLRLHLLVSLPPVLFLAVVLLAVTGLAWNDALIVLLCAVLFVELVSEAGLLLDLHSPHLQWTSETVPVKQSLTPLICLFGGWLAAAAIAGGGFLLADRVKPSSYLIACLFVLALAVRLLSRRIVSQGTAQWDKLV